MRKACLDDAVILLGIYDSANSLFPEELRGDGTIEIMEQVLNENDVYVWEEDGEAAGFVGFGKREGYAELNALYVRRDAQNRGIAGRMLGFFEEANCEKRVHVVSVLKNAPWAIGFYEKNGYEELTEDMAERYGVEGIMVQSWERVLCKAHGMRG